MDNVKNIILAADFGGTKGDLFVVDADNGSIIRHVFHTWRDLPLEILSEIKDFRGGIGRTLQMVRFCIEKALDGVEYENLFFISNGFFFTPQLVESFGIKFKKRLSMGETTGVMFAERCSTGICSLLGTGATGNVFIDGVSIFLIDSNGLVCGDWGGADYIGFNFLRNVLREQMFTKDIMPETNEIMRFIESNVKDAALLDHSKPMTYLRARGWIVSTIANHGNNVSLVSSFAEICDLCARKGSVIARNVLEMAGREVAENIYRSAEFNDVDKIDGLPIVVSGSVFIHSDFVFESFQRAISQTLPNAKVIRSRKPQTYGQVIRMLEEIHTPEAAVPMIERFKEQADKLLGIL